MNILFAASEAAPFAKTGGLADVAGSLPSALSALGHDVRLVMPRYQHVDTARFDLTHAATFHVPLGSWNERCDILQGRMGRNIIVYFVNKDRYYDRPGLYGTPRGDYPDNDERFIFFSRAALELCRALGFPPDIIHCNDWQTGLVPLYLKKRYAGTSRLKERGPSLPYIISAIRDCSLRKPWASSAWQGMSLRRRGLSSGERQVS